MFHVTTIKQFDLQATERLIEHAQMLRTMDPAKRFTRLSGKLVATLFYEPSTRTRLSFEAAAYRLGGQVISAENARENSSSKKGESLADVFRVVGAYVDSIVIRHHDARELDEAVAYAPVPIVNAGAGSGEHPTQALLDVYTIWRELGRLDNMTVAILGDLKYGRTVHSLLKMLSTLSSIHVKVFHPETLGLPQELHDEIVTSGVSIEKCESVSDALQGADIVYQTRIQSERFEGFEEAGVASEYAIAPQHLDHLPLHARILHPLPRVGEIDPSIDPDNRAAYFRQAENGLFLRMALLDQLLRGELG